MAKDEQQNDETEAPTEAVPTEEPVAGDDTSTEEAPAAEPEAEQVPEGEPVAETTAAEEAAVEEVVDEPAAATTPAPEAAAEAPPAAEAEAAPAAEPEPKRKKKRLPRALRRQRTKPTREKPAQRKPIARLPKPEGERGRRQERRGVVVSAAMDKTIVVKVETIRAHPKYKKVVRRSTKLHAHDEGNTAKPGDIVRIVETRPLSKTKNWRLAEVVEEAK
jgi:small subunit ribosomal protein S17